MRNRRIRNFVARVLNTFGKSALSLAHELKKNGATLIERGNERSLYKLPADFYLWLNGTGYIDLQIIANGVFEKSSTQAIQRIVKEGDVVLDVGANIGYYTVLLSKLVGENGKVIAFEPTKHYGDVLRMNIAANHLKNVEVVNFGLSNITQSLQIDIGPSSATLHSPKGFDKVLFHEKISLGTLDEYIKQHEPMKIDFIKIDIDGHEPLFFEGAWKTLEKYSPTVIFEVSHLHYLEAGIVAWEFYDHICSKGFRFFYEEDFSEIKSRENFLRHCANFACSTNVLISKKPTIN